LPKERSTGVGNRCIRARSAPQNFWQRQFNILRCQEESCHKINQFCLDPSPSEHEYSTEEQQQHQQHHQQLHCSPGHAVSTREKTCGGNVSFSIVPPREPRVVRSVPDALARRRAKHRSLHVSQEATVVQEMKTQSHDLVQESFDTCNVHKDKTSGATVAHDVPEPVSGRQLNEPHTFWQRQSNILRRKEDLHHTKVFYTEPVLPQVEICTEKLSNRRAGSPEDFLQSGHAVLANGIVCRPRRPVFSPHVPPSTSRSRRARPHRHHSCKATTKVQMNMLQPHFVNRASEIDVVVGDITDVDEVDDWPSESTDCTEGSSS